MNVFIFSNVKNLSNKRTKYQRKTCFSLHFQPKINKKLGVLKAIFSDFWGKKLYSCQNQKRMKIYKCLQISGLEEKQLKRWSRSKWSKSILK